MLIKRSSKLGFEHIQDFLMKSKEFIDDGKDPYRLVDWMGDCVKADFYEHTNCDISAFKIIGRHWVRWMESEHRKGPLPKLEWEISEKYRLIDGNLNHIREMFEDYKKIDGSNRKIRFYIILFGYVILHEVVIEQAELTFINTIRGPMEKEERKRLLWEYLKYKKLVVFNGKLKPDITHIRNTIAHGKFMTKDEKIYLYHEIDRKPEILPFQEIVDIFNVMMSKFEFIELIPLMVKYGSQLYYKEYESEAGNKPIIKYRQSGRRYPAMN